MGDDDAFDHRLLKQAQAYAQLYPSVIPRLRTALEAGQPALQELAQAMVQAMDRAKGRRERELRDAWGLSPQEVRVAVQLIDGGSVAGCATSLEIAESTVRSHLKSIFVKTGCKRQSQLSSLLQKNSTNADDE